MNSLRKTIITIMAAICFTFGTTLFASTVPLYEIVSSPGTVIQVGDRELAYYKEGYNLPNSCNYEWWYGCSPTAAGMVMSYHDLNGYSNLVPGGLAEINSFPSTPGVWDYLSQYAIASPGHVSDFYSGGYGVSGDDLPQPWHSFDSMADFMGTNQDNLSALYGGNSNGATTFFYYTDNTPLTEGDIFSYGYDYHNLSGMYGVGEYLRYAGYDADVLYNQRIYGYDGILAGFTFDQYKAEIDAGRPVIIHVEGHSMLGYGYVSGTTVINIFDTWSPNGQNPGAMFWGGTYPYGSYNLPHYGVTVVTPVPEPATVILLGLSMLVFLPRRRGNKNGEK